MCLFVISIISHLIFTFNVSTLVWDVGLNILVSDRLPSFAAHQIGLDLVWWMKV